MNLSRSTIFASRVVANIIIYPVLEITSYLLVVGFYQCYLGWSAFGRVKYLVTERNRTELNFAIGVIVATIICESTRPTLLSESRERSV